MKKLLSALLLGVMLFAFASLQQVKAEEPTVPVSPDRFTWIETDYIAKGKTMMYPQGSRATLTNPARGYSGVDVELGNFVWPMVAGGVDFTSDNKLVDGWGSISQLYINDTEQPYDVRRVANNDHIVIIADKDGRVVEIHNALAIWADFPADPIEGETYDVWWNDLANDGKGAMEYRSFKAQTHKPRVDEQLKYGDLGTNYKWLTKADVDAKTAVGVTLVDTDLLFIDAEGKYTNSNAEGNKKLMNADLGFTIPAGGFALKTRYLENGPYNNKDYYGQFWKLVNGESVVKIHDHDVVAPVISGNPASKNVKAGAELGDLLAGVKATDTGKLTVADDTTEPKVTVKYEKLNGKTQVWESVTALKFEFPGEKFRAVYEATDATGNKAVKYSEFTVIGNNAPIISGTKDIVASQGTAIDLLDGVTAVDGYENVILPENLVIVKGNLDLINPKPGIYEVTYIAKNALDATAYKTIKVTVKDTEAPQVIYPVEKVLVKKGDTTFKLDSVFFGIDNSGIVKKTILKDNFFSVDTVGTYEIEAQVSDADGNNVKIKFNVEVVDSFKDNIGRIEDLETGLKDDVSTVKSALETQLAELQTQMESKDQQALILTIVVAVISLAGLGVGFKSIFKK